MFVERLVHLQPAALVMDIYGSGCGIYKVKNVIYQHVMNKKMANALERPGHRTGPQHWQWVATITSSWLTRRNNSAPTPKPVATYN
ncbi:hypothetical protein Hanom_Chr16g01449751 [Helianthus anomalus]